MSREEKIRLEIDGRAPVIRITGEYKDNEKKIALFMHEKMEQWYRAAGAIAIQRQPKNWKKVAL